MKLNVKNMKGEKMKRNDDISINCEFEKNRRIESRTLYLFGEMCWDNTQELIEDLLYLDYINNKKPIYFYINSVGGSVDDGFALIDIMLSLKSPIITIAIGSVCSMASSIFICGTQGHRLISKNTWIMFHPIATDVGSDYVKFQKSRVNQAEQLEKQYDEIILTRTKIPVEEYNKAKNTELWLSAESALAYKIADNYYKSAYTNI